MSRQEVINHEGGAKNFPVWKNGGDNPMHFSKKRVFAAKLIAPPVIVLVALGLSVIPSAGAWDVSQNPAGSENPAAASQTRPLGTVVNGNTTIIFEPADERDIDVAHLVSWGEFASAHPQIARTVAYQPALLRDPGFLGKHPELVDFFRNHPDTREAILENPGNFEAIPPRPGE
jgi:hypothetical protein